MYTSKAFELISEFYGDQTTNRSGVKLINHISEGIEILEGLNAASETIDAYCLHPIVQSDESLPKGIKLLWDNSFDLSVLSIMYALEYRKTANAYLSKRIINSIDEIELSTLLEVNQMLWADKIQNQKDFRLYHLNTHPRSAILEQYFINWIERLKPVIFPEQTKLF